MSTNGGIVLPNGSAPVLTLRASDIVMWKSCQKKFEYRNIRGWRPPENNQKASEGTLIHAGIAAAYNTPDDPLTAAIDALRSHEGWERFEEEDRNRIEDVVRYYWENKKLTFSEIIGTEVEIEMTLLVPDMRQQAYTPVRIISHLDLAGRDTNGKLVVLDHKTKDKMPSEYEWFQLSTQMRVYQLAAWRKYGEVPKVIHNLVRRQVPPGYGHRQLRLNKDGSVAKNNASTDVNDYLRTFAFEKSEKTLGFYAADLQATVTELYNAVIMNSRNERSDGMQCGFCPYFTVCSIESDGERVSNEQANLLFETKEKE